MNACGARQGDEGMIQDVLQWGMERDGEQSGMGSRKRRRVVGEWVEESSVCAGDVERTVRARAGQDGTGRAYACAVVRLCDVRVGELPHFAWKRKKQCEEKSETVCESNECATDTTGEGEERMLEATRTGKRMRSAEAATGSRWERRVMQKVKIAFGDG